MFNRHQAEITVIQFTGHSLPVHQSMSVPWEFFSSSHFISQFPPTRFPLITAIRMCHFLPVHHFGMAFLAGSKGQNITTWSYRIQIFVTLISLTYRWNYHSVFRIDIEVMAIKRIPLPQDLQNWSLTIRSSLKSYRTPLFWKGLNLLHGIYLVYFNPC